jgi:hypothetical protein
VLTERFPNIDRHSDQARSGLSGLRLAGRPQPEASAPGISRILWVFFSFQLEDQLFLYFQNGCSIL